jgi:hypothetical protein
MPQHIIVSTANAARVVTASSAVTMPRPSRALIKGNLIMGNLIIDNVATLRSATSATSHLM